jgi:hypothetical protein
MAKHAMGVHLHDVLSLRISDPLHDGGSQSWLTFFFNHPQSISRGKRLIFLIQNDDNLKVSACLLEDIIDSLA